MLNGDTPTTTTFKSPMIYNPWFEKRGINAAVVPLGVKGEDFARAFPEICRFTNFYGALITMPHKIAVIGLIDEMSTAVKVAGSCNAVRRNGDGRLVGDMFDGEGFVRGMARRGRRLKGKKVLVIGSGGVGSAIAASSAAAGAAEIGLYDVSAGAMETLAGRLRQNYPHLKASVGSNDPIGFDVVVVIVIPFVGNLSDQIGRRTPIIVGSLAAGLLTFVYLYVISIKTCRWRSSSRS